MKLKVHVVLKNGVLDPQGEATKNTLHSLGFTNVNDVRQGKYIELDIEESDTEKAKSTVIKMCDQLLANIVIEEYLIDVE